jgi:hypothetical protein
VVSGPQQVTSIRQAAAICNVTPPVVRRWLSLGLMSGPPWTVQQLHQIRDETDPEGRRRGPRVPHGTLTRWLEGCYCDRCRAAQNDAARARFRRRVQERLPPDIRKQLLDAIYGRLSVPVGAPRSWPDFQPGVGPHQDGREMVGSARSRTDGNSSRRPPARYECRIRTRLRLQGVPGASAHSDGAAIYQFASQ